MKYLINVGCDLSPYISNIRLMYKPWYNAHNRSNHKEQEKKGRQKNSGYLKKYTGVINIKTTKKITDTKTTE